MKSMIWQQNPLNLAVVEKKYCSNYFNGIVCHVKILNQDLLLWKLARWFEQARIF